MAQQFRCPNETRVSLVEVGLASMKEDLIEIKSNLKAFIETADKKYATKEELSDKLAAIRDQAKVDRTQLQKVTDVLAKWGPLVSIITWAVLGKVI